MPRSKHARTFACCRLPIEVDFAGLTVSAVAALAHSTDNVQSLGGSRANTNIRHEVDSAVFVGSEAWVTQVIAWYMAGTPPMSVGHPMNKRVHKLQHGNVLRRKRDCPFVRPTLSGRFSALWKWLLFFNDDLAII